MKKYTSKTKLLFCIISIISSTIIFAGCSKRPYIPSKHLNDTIVTIDNVKITTKEMLYYIMVIENEVESQALIYSSSNPRSYWNIHVNGVFMSVYAKDITMNQVIQTEIYYRLALDNNIALTPDELSKLSNTATDKYNDMSDYQKQSTCLDYDTIYNQVTKSAIAEKYQEHLMKEENLTSEQVSPDGDYFKSLLEMHVVKINNSIWDRVNFGEVTIKHT